MSGGNGQSFLPCADLRRAIFGWEHCRPRGVADRRQRRRKITKAWKRQEWPPHFTLACYWSMIACLNWFAIGAPARSAAGGDRELFHFVPADE